jgi:PEGA domain
VPVADYSVNVTLAGFQQFTTRVTVAAGKTARLDIVLQADKETIHQAIARLEAGGSTNGADRREARERRRISGEVRQARRARGVAVTAEHRSAQRKVKGKR